MNKKIKKCNKYNFFVIAICLPIEIFLLYISEFFLMLPLAITLIVALCNLFLLNSDFKGLFFSREIDGNYYTHNEHSNKDCKKQIKGVK